MKIKSKLYLNMSPQTSEEGSLAFARNMKVDDDGNLVTDYGYKNISALANYTNKIVGNIVGLDNKVYFFYSTSTTTNNVTSWTNSGILEYDEVNETITLLTTVWTYNGGKIDGYVSTNISGEKILSIAEHLDEGSNVPIKHINLSYANVSDESLYTQAPKVPTANLTLSDTYVKTIPNGTYVFFIRYKIRKDVYTNWYLCSAPIFAGTSDEMNTLQGGLKYVNLKKDSAKSFVFNISFLNTSNKNFYSEFQLGFIITHDDATNARTWKHFAMDTTTIYFDYEDVEEINIDNLLEITYDLHNVGNVTSFKNKLYISNYIESDFNNPELNTLASKISLSVAHTETSIDTTKQVELNGYNLSYDEDAGYYPRYSDTSTTPPTIITVKNLIFNQAFTPDAWFSFDISNLIKGNNKEKEGIVKFDIGWRHTNNPDICAIYNIFNYIDDKEVFGPNYDDAFELGTSSHQGRVGIKEIWEGERTLHNNWWLFRVKTSSDTPGNPHPWYDLDLTVGYGSAKEEDRTDGICRNGVYYFKKGTDNYQIIDEGTTYTGWPCRDVSFDDFARSAIENNIKDEIRNKSFFGQCYIEIASGATVYTIGYDKKMDSDTYAGYSDLDILPLEYATTDVMADTFIAKIKGYICDAIKSKIVGVDDNGTCVLSIDGNIIRASSMSIKFKRFDFDVDSTDIEVDSTNYFRRYSVTMKTTDYTSFCTFSLKSDKISITDNDSIIHQASSLMPFSTYQPYVHFVDEHNIVTNGVKLASFTTGKAKSNADVLYLKYAVGSNIPTNKYKSFFISLVNVGDIITEGFDYSRKDNLNILHCLEIDTLLYNLNDNITIIDDTGTVVTTTAKYYPSGASYPILAFGNAGFIGWESNNTYSNKNFYIKITRNKSKENIKSLVKASNYIEFTTRATAIELPGAFYGSYLCKVKKPDFSLSSSAYVAGSDVYSVNRTTALTLKDFKSYIQTQTSKTYIIRSNYNLNYLSLTEDIADRIFSVGAIGSTVKQIAKVVNSATLSYIYELKGMYKDFSNKYFRPIETEYRIDFDNTVRVSNVLSDETFNNSIFKFYATDYYNVPTDRGIIVNLFTIGNTIYVHTKSSLYKFDGNQTIAASESDISLKESEPFDNGIANVFDSEYGYGGIQNKEAGCVTFDSYFFYDGETNHIFAYGGNGQANLIDASIYKMLSYYNPSFCRTVHDDTNHRILFEFTSNKFTGIYKTFTLSYNYKAKSFVSVHDLSLDKAFHSKSLVYSYKNVFCKLFDTTGNIDNTVFDADLNVIKLYGDATTCSAIQFGATTQQNQSTPFNIAVVLFPTQDVREAVNNISFIGRVISDNYDEKVKYDVISIPQVTRNNPINKFYIITDSCVSIPVTGTVNDEARPNTLLDYKGFKYDKGIWNSNYFRNALNVNNVYNYPDQPRASQVPNNDNYSLVYGRYFILVFDFIKTNAIKIEEVSVNSNMY